MAEISPEARADKQTRRRQALWMSYFVLISAVFVPLAYQANSIDKEITMKVLEVVTAISISSDALGFLHRKLTEKLKGQSSDSASKQS